MNEVALIQAIQSNDRDAFDKLVDQYYRMVYGICLRMTGNAVDAGELAHDTFVEAYLKIGRVRDADKLGGWLRTLTLNVCRMWYRQKSKLITVELDENIPAAISESDDRCVRMYYGMSKLSPDHRMVLALHYFEGLSYDEIARFLDKPQGTVMSRLNRARNLLKEELQQMTEENDIPEIADIRFKEEIQAEIALLLSMDKGKPGTGKRLRVILEKSPERLVRLLEDSDSEMQLNIAIALPRLGEQALSEIVAASVNPDANPAEQAKSVLKNYISRCVPITTPKAQPDMPSADAYALMDRLIENGTSDRIKAESLIEWIDSCKDSATQVMLVNGLLRYVGEAFDLLLNKFTGDKDGRSGWVRHALVRTGNRFCCELSDLLESEREDEIRLGLQGFEAIARSLMHSWISESSPEKFAHELRIAERYPPLRFADIDAELLGKMKVKTSGLLIHGDADVRNSALNVLGILNAREYLDKIRACMSHENQSTRLTAIRVLSGMQDETIADELLKRTQSGEDVERAAAVKALGQMSISESVFFLSDLIADPCESVRHAAITSLGEIYCDESLSILKGLMTSGDISVRKTVAKALYGGKPDKHHEPSEVDRKLAEKRRKKAQPVAFISLDAAIRYALPEIRPYDERDLSDRIACVCEDYCTTRRNLIERGLMTRSQGTYEFTELGKTVWRVEQFIMQ